jgi:CRISPR-associated protein Cmr3
MNEQIVRIRGIDPLLFRDGRPFSNEPGAFNARTLATPWPGTIAGFLRTRIGNKEPGEWEWNQDKANKMRKIEIAGPILKLNNSLVFHAPADALIYKDKSDNPKVMCLRPRKDAMRATDIPDGIQPLDIKEDVKPETDYNFWESQDMEEWLLYPSGDNFSVPQNTVRGLPREERVHVEISDEMGTSQEGRLFSAQFLSFEKHKWEQFQKKQKDKWSLIAKVNSENGNPIGVGQLGGENRSAAVEAGEESDWPACPEELKTTFSSANRVKMILATPAIFAGGWKPGWLDGYSNELPPALKGCKLKLIAAAVKRREPVSGWDYLHKQPKPVQWMVPAGSVYFFEIEGSPGFPVDQAWLQPVSDNPLDRADGFGLALWGIWNYNKQGDAL